MDVPSCVRNYRALSPLAGVEAPIFEVMTTPTAAQRRAFESIEHITRRQNAEPRIHCKPASQQDKLALGGAELQLGS